MKRIVVYAAIAALVLMVPVKGNDVGKLRPVQAISVYKTGAQFVIETDTEDVGVGATADQALKNLKDTTPAIIYLDTADYLLLTEDVLDELQWLRDNLKSSVRLCMMRDRIEPKKAAEFLKVHRNLPELKAWKNGERIPILTRFGERIILLPENENNA